ncbi:MAG: RagB/SusD domain protein [Chitinophagaceae bacterium]|nr:RagB/SusD domain protein [Chitinophagaceae bacterium]
MKKIFSYTLFFIVMVVIGSCKKAVNETPLSDGTLNQFFKSKYDVYAAVAGMYGAFQTTMVGESQFNNRITWWGDSRSDNIQNSTPNSNSNEVHFNNLTPNNSYADWSPLYTVIGRANLNIAKFPDVNNSALAAERITDAELKSYMSQCYAMRALCYFYILRIWGDAPIRLAPFLDLNDNPFAPRDPKTKVKAQIIADLKTAYDLTVKGATPSVWYLGEAAIAATMADVYMWKSHDNQIVPEYANAITWIKNVFAAKSPTGKTYTGTPTANSSGLSPDLVPTAEWKTIFTNPAANIETIFNIHWDVSSNGCPCMMAVSSTVNNTPMKTADELVGKTPSNPSAWLRAGLDIRAKQTIDSAKSDNFDRIIKWYGPAGYINAKTTYLTRAQSDAVVGTDKPVYFPIYRLADIFLLYAEALNKTGDAANAIKYLNFVHQRATLPAYTSAQLTTQAQIEDAILQERQWELFDEGKRWFDLCRTDHVIPIMDPILKKRQLAAGAAQIGWGTDVRRYLWPLNRNVLNANPNLVQNPPYSD